MRVALTKKKSFCRFCTHDRPCGPNGRCWNDEVREVKNPDPKRFKVGPHSTGDNPYTYRLPTAEVYCCGQRKPQPTDGPEYHTELSFWMERHRNCPWIS